MSFNNFIMKGIAKTLVIAVPDEIFGQVIKAFIVRENISELSKAEVMSFCKKNLEPFMVPKYLEFCTVLPKSSSGKVDKKRIAV